MFYDYSLNIQYKDPLPLFSKITEKYPKLNIKYWCSGVTDIVEIDGFQKDELEINRDQLIRQYFKNITFMNNSDHKSVFFRVCNCDYPLWELLSKYGGFDVNPAYFLAGIHNIRLIIPSDISKKFISGLKSSKGVKEVEILSVVPLSVDHSLFPLYFSLDELISNLSLKQIESISNAYYKGYYEIPRKTKTEILSIEQNISRRTYEEHLRKAENRIMAHIIPILMTKKKLWDTYGKK